jgi:hypothetical protein
VRGPPPLQLLHAGHPSHACARRRAVGARCRSPGLAAALSLLAAPAAAAEGEAAGGRYCDAAALPPVIIGCWQLLERHSDPEVAVATLLAYAEAGFTAFDTADIYGPSERILGAFREASLRH